MLTDPDGDYIELTEMHSPKKMLQLIDMKSEYGALPRIEEKGLRNCQYEAEVNFENSITNISDSKLNFRFTNFNASMINWGKNRGLYLANYYFGYPRGYLIVPGSDNIINSTSSILAINTVGKIPSRYEHNIIVGLVYIPYAVKPIPVFIYDSKPQSQNSKIIKFLYNNKDIFKIF